MRYSNRELWMSFIGILLITLMYLFVVVSFSKIPGASDLFGHSLGIIGFILMLLTETLYSWRKRSRSARWGKMSEWLEFHIFSGLVGPYMVLLHTSWKFNGLAGMVVLLTVVVVASGFIGRYIYTAVPRSADGIEIEADQLEKQIQLTNDELNRWLENQPEAVKVLSRRLAAAPVVGVGGVGILLGRYFAEIGARIRWGIERVRMDAAGRAQAGQLEILLRRQSGLQRQLVSLAFARNLLGVWHAVHIPIGMALFTAALIHIVAAVYYATLLR
jgi:hypothetical protein